MWYYKVYAKKFENIYIAEHLLLAVSELCVLAIFINYILIKKCVSQSWVTKPVTHITFLHTHGERNRVFLYKLRQNEVI